MEKKKPFTEAEQEVMDLLVEAHNKFVALTPTHPSDTPEWVSGIHKCQSVLMRRALQNEFPYYFSPTPIPGPQVTGPQVTELEETELKIEVGSTYNLRDGGQAVIATYHEGLNYPIAGYVLRMGEPAQLRTWSNEGTQLRGETSDVDIVSLASKPLTLEVGKDYFTRQGVKIRIVKAFYQGSTDYQGHSFDKARGFITRRYRADGIYNPDGKPSNHDLVQEASNHDLVQEASNHDLVQEASNHDLVQSLEFHKGNEPIL